MVQVITDSATLRSFCRSVLTQPYVTVDTEFIRESTFWPDLCLLQMATPEEAALIDPKARDLDLSPVREVMAAQDVVKVFHAARQDVEIFWHRLNVIPYPLFDSQVAAMVCGFGENVSYERLVLGLTQGSIDKAGRYVDWARRPLPQAALDYALGDVTWLRDIYHALSDRIRRSGRQDWIEEEHAILTDPATYQQDPDTAWQRLKTRSTKPRYLGLLRAVAAWREREAQRRNQPRSWVLRDDAVQEIAATAPKTKEALAQVRGLNKGLLNSSQAEVLLADIRHVLELPKHLLPEPELEPGVQSGTAAAEMLKVLLKIVCDQQEVAPKLIADSRTLDRLARGDREGLACLTGWRHEIFGRDALALLEGKVALALQRGRIRAIALP